MQKLFLGLVAALFLVNAVQADVCDPCGPCVFDGCGSKESLWFYSGHIEAGLYANEYGNKDRYLYNNGTFLGTVPGNTGHLLNVRNTGFQVNQTVFSFGKNLDARHHWDLGGRVDVAFGTDALVLQSRGLEYGSGHGKRMTGNHAGGRWGTGDYFTTLAQVLMEAGYKKFNIKFGKFLNPMGYESALATHRFFYSLNDAFGILPRTQSGILASYEINRKFSVFAGWTQGYDSDFSLYPNSDDLTFDSSKNNAFLAGIRFDMNKRTYLKYSVLLGHDTTGDLDHGIPAPGERYGKNSRNYFIQSLIFGYKPGKRWDYTFEWTLRNDRNKFNRDEYYVSGITDLSVQKQYWGAYGINQELIYKIDSQWSVGLRAEWAHYFSSQPFQTDRFYNGRYVGGFSGNRGRDELDKYTFTFGVNWKPSSWILIRPELRYDKFDGANDLQFAEKNGRGRDKQFSGGFSTVVIF